MAPLWPSGTLMAEWNLDEVVWSLDEVVWDLDGRVEP